MKISDLSVLNFNRSISKTVSKHNLNFCSAIALSYDSNLSITGNYCPDLYQKNYCVLDRSLNPRLSSEFDKYYYGVAPQIDSYAIIKAISSLRFTSTLGLNSFISENAEYFMLHTNQAKYLADFARHAVIAVAVKFGIAIALDPDKKEQLCSLDSTGEILKPCESHIEIHGCPTDAILEYLSQFRFKLNDQVWTSDTNGLTIKEIYSNAENIRLLNGRVFYSGTLIKPLSIHPPKDRYENEHIKNVQIDFERTTFITVCALDEVHIHHPLLTASRANLIKLFEKDDNCKLALQSSINSAESESDILTSVNEYLTKCFNVNQIGITANLVCGDNTLLLGLRDQGNVDEYCFYPGINGNAEIQDENVSFYSYSIHADYPTVDIRKKRIDFSGEIAREMYDEIKLEQESDNWLCYGLTLSGQMPDKPMSEDNICSHRRLHFNIIFEKRTDLTPKDIQERRNKASESFETSFFKGTQISFYKSFSDMTVKKTLSLLKLILSLKDIWESIALILIVTISLSRGNTDSLSWLDISSLIFAALITIITAHNTYKAISERIKWKKLCNKKKCAPTKLTIYKNDSYDKVCKKIDSIFIHECHPVACGASKMFVENMIFEKLKEDPSDK